MKSKQKKDLHQKTVEELKQELNVLETELTKARLELSAQKLDDVSKPKRLTKEVAVIKTIITEKENQVEEKEEKTE